MDEHRKMEINSDRTIPTAISPPPPPTHNEGGKKLFRRERFNSTETEINAGMKFRRGREGERDGTIIYGANARRRGDDAFSQADVGITTGCCRQAARRIVLRHQDRIGRITLANRLKQTMERRALSRAPVSPLKHRAHSVTFTAVGEKYTSSCTTGEEEGEIEKGQAVINAFAVGERSGYDDFVAD